MRAVKPKIAIVGDKLRDNCTCHVLPLANELSLAVEQPMINQLPAASRNVTNRTERGQEGMRFAYVYRCVVHQSCNDFGARKHALNNVSGSELAAGTLLLMGLYLLGSKIIVTNGVSSVTTIE
jgi:hypothetical protein